MNKITLVILVLVGLFIVPKAEAQTETYKYPDFNLGIYGGLNMNLHNPSFPYTVFIAPDGILRSTNYTVDDYESGIGFNAGFIVNYPLTDIFTLSGRLGYNGLGGTLVTSSENDQFFLDLGATTSNTNVSLEATLGYFEISPMVQLYNLVPVDNFYFLVGPEIGIPISNDIQDNSTLTLDGQTTSLGVQPNGGNEFEIADADIRFALGIGVGYSFEVSENIFVTPEISYRLPFTDISSAENEIGNGIYDSWSSDQFRLSVALTFGFDNEEDPAVDDESTLEVGFSGVNYLDNNGNKKPVKNIKVEEVQYAELYPLIPYVFFDQNESSLSKGSQVLHNKNQTGAFEIEDLEEDVLAINKSTLDIIGTRLTKYPDSEVTIVGTNDGKEVGGTSLSQKRADYAKAYLVSNYGVDGSKLKTKSQNLPDNPSTSRVAEGMSENRRAEFYTKNPNILEPIILESESTKIAAPNLVVFSPYANSSDPVGEWGLIISQSGKTLKKINGVGEISDISWSIQPNQIMQTNVPVDYNLTVENSKGVRKMASGTIPVEYLSYQLKQSEKKAGKTISKYSLVVFDFDSPDISAYDQKIIEKYILPSIKFNSTVAIYGYTDDIGSAAYNKKLAGQRAENVKNFISAKNPSAKYEVYAVGEESNIVNNKIPVGRQLSRTVQVYVITPSE